MDLKQTDQPLVDPTETSSLTHRPEIALSTGLGEGPRGLMWAMLSPLFLGTVPILAKLAFAAGADVRTVVAFRTLLAAAALWLGVLLFARHLISSSLPATSSSLIAGGINGVGSLFFYGSLARIDASLGQLINITYLIFVTLLMRLAGHRISLLTVARVGLAILAMALLTFGGLGQPDWTGVGMMLTAAFMYALQLVLSQRIMYDMPAPTMTLYGMSGMAIVVAVAWAAEPTDLSEVSVQAWQLILLLGIVTLLSRLTLFLGVKKLGSIQTALMGVLEVVVTIAIAMLLLDDGLTLIQWLGAILLVLGVMLVRYEHEAAPIFDWWQMIWRWRLHK